MGRRAVTDPLPTPVGRTACFRGRFGASSESTDCGSTTAFSPSDRRTETYDAPGPEPEVAPEVNTRAARTVSRVHGGQPRTDDVASVAGVSHQALSRVLNDFPNVRASSTRARVLAAIEELGYRGNTAARTLVTRRSGTIEVIIAGKDLFGPASIMLGLESASRAAGYNLSLTGLSDISVAALRTAVDRFWTGRSRR